MQLPVQITTSVFTNRLDVFVWISSGWK